MSALKKFRVSKHFAHFSGWGTAELMLIFHLWWFEWQLPPESHISDCLLELFGPCRRGCDTEVSKAHQTQSLVFSASIRLTTPVLILTCLTRGSAMVPKAPQEGEAESFFVTQSVFILRLCCKRERYHSMLGLFRVPGHKSTRSLLPLMN